jgi:hypothetical protein
MDRRSGILWDGTHREARTGETMIADLDRLISLAVNSYRFATLLLTTTSHVLTT